MSLFAIRSILAEESKRRTQTYFDSKLPVTPPKPLTAQATQAAEIIKDGEFGCKAPAIAKLVSALIDEDILPVVCPPPASEPQEGAAILFLSELVAPGKWLAALKINEDYYVSNCSKDTFTLTQAQLLCAKQPTEKEIDDLYAQFSCAQLKTIVVSTEFGLETITKD